ncbi:MAG: Fe3+-hydroxamate ABC transporter periplasmic protein [Bacteroidetes bacterium]|nr:MAG: Fe3+-hydroxamate ABC transporter periplasmic protein [Bacteroidota bacterium]
MSRIFIDQMNREVIIPGLPKRIISLVPSQTELLSDLGLEEETIGITKFCIHPEKWFREKTRVGGTKQLDFERIAGLKPDLIIGNKEENEQEQIEILMRDYTVWMSDIRTLDDAYVMMEQIGAMTGREEKANALVGEIRSRFRDFQRQEKKKRPCLYFIWKNPWMCAGPDTFIDHLLNICGFENLATGFAGRYPEFTAEEIKKLAPEVLLLSSEPYPFKEKHIADFQTILPDAKILLADGEMFSWYGSRLRLAVKYFKDLLQQAETI